MCTTDNIWNSFGHRASVAVNSPADCQYCCWARCTAAVAGGDATRYWLADHPIAFAAGPWWLEDRSWVSSDIITTLFTHRPTSTQKFSKFSFTFSHLHEWFPLTIISLLLAFVMYHIISRTQLCAQCIESQNIQILLFRSPMANDIFLLGHLQKQQVIALTLHGSHTYIMHTWLHTQT